MSEAKFIGVVDLTVKLSSMNPLGHIDVRTANGVFERVVIQACQHVYAHSERGADMLRRGVVKEGPAAKFFHFTDLDDMLRFSTKLRALLIEKRLPFKLCLRSGTLGSLGLRERWGPILDAAHEEAPSSARDEARGALLREFETFHRPDVERLFELYLAPGFHDDAVTLAMDLETFKGFGIHIDPAACEKATDVSALFRNHFPTRGKSRQIVPAEYIDCLFERDEQDVVTRLAAQSAIETAMEGEEEPAQPVEDASATGSAIIIEGVLDLLRRSFRANEESAVFYVSTLTTIVRSSHFGSMRHLAKSAPIPGSAKRLAAGWQEAPPVFGTLIESRNRQMLRRIAGIELVLAAMVDEIYAAIAGGDSSATLQGPGTGARLGDREVAQDETFIRAIGALQSAFGDAAMRKVLATPATVISEARKRAVLAVTSST